MATLIDKARGLVGKAKNYLDADPTTQGFQFGVPASLSKLPQSVSNFVQKNPTPAGFIGSKLPASVRRSTEQNLGRLRNVDIASTAVGGAMKSYIDTKNQPFYSPQKLIAQNFPVVGAIKNITSQRPTFASEQIQRTIPGLAGQVAGLGTEMFLPGLGGEVKAGQSFLKTVVKQAPRSILAGAGEANSLSQIPQNVGTNLLLAGGLSAISPVLSRTRPNAKAFYNGEMSPGNIRRSVDAITEHDNLLKEAYSIEQSGKLSKIEQTLRNLAEDYIGKDFVKKASIEDIKQELFNRIQVDSKPFQMGLVGNQPLRKNRLGSYTNVPEIDNPLLKRKPDELLNEARREIKPTTSKSKSLGQMWKQFYTDYVNRFQPVEDIVNQIQKQTKTEILPDYNPKTQIMRLLGAGGTAEQRHRKVLDPILKAIDKSEMADFDVYLKARRDIGFGSIGREVVGSDPIKAQAVIDALGSKYDLNKFDQVAQQLYKYQDENLNRLVQEGFIDQNTFNAIRGNNPDYVPFQRVMDDIDNFIGLPTRRLSQGTNPVKKLEGSERAVLSPIESIIADTYKMEAAVAKNRVARSIGQLSQILPDIGIKQVSKSSENTIPVWVGGKKMFYEVPDDVNRVIKGLNEEQQGIIVKVLSMPASILRQGATGRNIDFMIPNIIRDQFDAALNSKYGYRPFIDYFNGLAELIKYKTGKPSLYEDWANSGGKIFYEMAGGRKAIAKEISDATKQKSLGNKFFRAIITGLDTMGEFSETPTRLGLYKRAYEKTGNKFISAKEAREGTLDFARMGAKMKTANAIIPFLNVGVQGFDKLMRTAKNQPQKLLLYGIIYGVAPQVALTVYNNTFHPEEYAEIPPEIKQDNFVFVTGRNKDGRVNYLTLAKGNVLPYIANPADNLLSVAAGYDRQKFSQLALTLLGEALPLIEPGKDLQQTVSKSVGSVIPQAVKPTIETLANYSFYKGREIVPSYLKNKPVIEQAYNFTETPYKYLGNVLQISPLKVKNFLEGTIAGYIKTPMQVLSIAQKISRGEKPSPNEIPVLRRFISETYDTSEQFKKKQQKEQETIAQKELNRKQIAPIQKRLFGEVSAAEEFLPANTTVAQMIQKQKKDSDMVSDYKDIITGKKIVNNVDEYLKETYGSSSREVERKIIKNLDVSSRTPVVAELLKDKKTTTKEFESLISDSILTDDVAKNLLNNGNITEDAYKKLLSYMKWVKAGKKTKTSTGTRKRAKKRAKPVFKAPRITLKTVRPKQYKKLTLKDLYQKNR